jgi:hypothetical protein
MSIGIGEEKYYMKQNVFRILPMDMSFIEGLIKID